MTTENDNADQCARLAPPLKWHGGKHYLAPKIVALMPPRCQTPNKPAPDDTGWLHYVEPYAGGLSVLLANDPHGISEVVSDMHGELTNFWRVLQDPALFAEFVRRLDAVPFAVNVALRCRDGNVARNASPAVPSTLRAEATGRVRAIHRQAGRPATSIYAIDREQV
jgi:hypothetical protein